MKIISPLLTFALLSAVRPARADTIYLKNGGKMKGTVTSQNSSEVVLDLGYGTITTEMSEIKKISRSAGKKSQADAKSLELKEFETGSKVPEGADELNELYQEARFLRGKASSAAATRQMLQDSAQAAQADLPNLQGLADNLQQQQLQQPRSQRRQDYKSTKTQLTSISEQMGDDQQNIDYLQQEQQQGNADIQDYADAFKRLQDYLQGSEGAGLGENARGWEADYYLWIRGAVGKMADELNRSILPHS